MSQETERKLWQEIERLKRQVERLKVGEVGDYETYVNSKYYYGTYTPAWTSTGTAPSIGNGTINAVYYRANRLVLFWVRVLFGSTTSAGTGIYSISLPVEAITMAYNTPLGGAQFSNYGIRGYAGLTVYDTSTKAISKYVDGTTYNWLQHNYPFAFGSGDSFEMAGVYIAFAGL